MSSRYWGHLGLLNLTQHFLIPGYAAYPNTAAASLYPTNAAVADMAHQQNALVGYVHPYDTFPDPAKDPALTHELPGGIGILPSGLTRYRGGVNISDTGNFVHSPQDC